MKLYLHLFVVLFACVPCLIAGNGTFEQLRQKAETLYNQGSYAKARDVYLEAAKQELPQEERLWVDFRLADTLWRSQNATQTSDPTLYDQALSELQEALRQAEKLASTRLEAQIRESIGDYWWIRRDVRNWHQAWQHYPKALDYWAGSSDLDAAREHYLGIVWKLARPDQHLPWPRHGYPEHFNIPVEVLENAVKIAKAPNDLAHAHYLLAMGLRNRSGDWLQRKRIPEEFESALKAGKSTPWHDDALYQYAEWMMGSGRAIPLENGQWRQEPDYPKALELFRELTTTYSKGETAWHDEALQRIKEISEISIDLMVEHIFLPESEVQFLLQARNVAKVQLTLHRVDLTRGVRFAGKEDHVHDWLKNLQPSDARPVKSWAVEIKDSGDHKPAMEKIRLDSKPAPGAYLLEARAGGKSARELLLVSDVTLVVKHSGGKVLAWLCNAMEGSPIPGAKVKIFERVHRNSEDVWREEEKQATEAGLALFDLGTPNRSHSEFFIAAESEDQKRQAFSVGHSYGGHNGRERWKLYAFTDRPAYRPNETVHWKFLARTLEKTGAYRTPSGQSFHFEITDPRGAKIHEGTADLNSFGSAAGSLDLTPTMPLGEYQLTAWTEGKKHHIGSATLFRLEEYKLPEFKVTVKMPEQNGKPKALLLGEEIEAGIHAEYYFGGAVTSGTVEVVVHQGPYHQHWHPPIPYPWYYEDMRAEIHPPHHHGRGQIIKRETLKLDANGKAAIKIQTPAYARNDFEYRIETRVTDASRREVTGSGTVRVTRQPYFVNLKAEHSIYKPQARVTTSIKALDANQQGVKTAGTLRITRDHWFEIWVSPDGREVKGEELEKIRAQCTIFPPPPPQPNQPGWRLKFRGYQHDEILKEKIKNDESGEAEISFTPGQEGYYRIAWESQGANKQPITSDTTVWVATNTTHLIGYKSGTVEIILDKETFHEGQKAAVMLSVRSPQRHVLFTIEGEELFHHEVVHLTGNVKLMEIPIEEKHVPNFFVGAAMVGDRELFTDTKQVVVPPVKHFLTVEVESDREEYQPREEGTFKILTTNHEGKPVSSEVAFGLVDQSVYHIQQDYAMDPRKFFYGDKRSHQVQTHSTFNQKRYIRFIEGSKEDLIEERELDRVGERKEGYGGVAAADGFADEARPMMEAASNMRVKRSMAPAAAMGKATFFSMQSKDSMEMVAMSPPMEALNEHDPAMGEIQVRSDFRSTIFWNPSVITGPDGRATVKVKYPDSLTAWKATARAASSENQFGLGDESTRTKKPLIARLQTPRFLVVGDKVTLSGVINNNTDANLAVKADLELSLGNRKLQKQPPKNLSVGGNGDSRADWTYEAKEPGELKLVLTSRGGKHSDGMTLTIPVYEHGIEKLITKAGKVRGKEVKVIMDIPRERKADSTALQIQIAPSMATTMLDALPYLIHYPYGCTEQTMSRFLPAAITAKTLEDQGIEAADIMGRVFGGIEAAHVSKTHPKGKNDLAKLEDMIAKGLERLYDFQHGDGGWGWWKDGDSDPYMSAYVIWGLTLARQSGIGVREDVFQRGETYLRKGLVEAERQPDLQAWMLHALAANQNSSSQNGARHKLEAKAFQNLWDQKNELNSYSRSLLALCAHAYGMKDKADILVDNLKNGVKHDRNPDLSIIQDGASGASSHEGVIPTAHWGDDSITWRWSEGSIEATAFGLKALLAIAPDDELVEPVSNWLIKNRRGAQWSNTRDTAIAILAFNDYLKKTNELSSNLEYEVVVNGKSIKREKITSASEALKAPNKIAVEPDQVRDGQNEIIIRKISGTGNLYFSTQAAFFSMEEPIPEAGHEIFVRRDYYKLVSHPTLLKGHTYEKQPLADGGNIKSGDRIEVVLTIESKNNYEYLVFEDLKPAGFEAVELRSGSPLHAHELRADAVKKKFQPADSRVSGSDQRRKMSARSLARPGSLPIDPPTPTDPSHTGKTRWVHQEFRDRKVAMFIDKLPEGVWEIRYELRAEAPGEFHALPLLGHAMYVPEIRANSRETRVKVVE